MLDKGPALSLEGRARARRGCSTVASRVARRGYFTAVGSCDIWTLHHYYIIHRGCH